MFKPAKTPSGKSIFLSEDSSLIMGILNFTPDSFSENGEFFDKKKAISHCKKMIEDGVDIIDLGLESTRPNAVKVSEEEELKRLKEILPALKRACKDTLISLDTYKPNVAKYAIENGVDIINCVFGGAFDDSIEQDAMYKVVAHYNCPIVITHNSSINTINDVLFDLEHMANLAISYGLFKNKIILDYGFGFNKTMQQNLLMQKEIESFKKLGFPLLIGVSRKSTLREIVGENREDLDDATLAFFAHSLTKKAVSIFRTHNVKKAVICRDCLDNLI